MPENLYNISDIDNPEVQNLISEGVLNPQDTDPFGSALAAGAITPEQFQSFKTLQYGAEYEPFKYRPSEEYVSEAEKDISPYYKSLYAGLSDLEKAEIEETEETYDDLMKNLQDEYNRRGTFFGGEAMVGAGRLLGRRGRAITGVRAGFEAERAGLRMEERKKISTKAEDLRQRDYNEYWTERTESINQQVLTDLSEWLPAYTKTIQDQMEDDNALWLDIPLEDEAVEPTPTPEPTPEPTPTPQLGPRGSSADYARSRGVQQDPQAEQNALNEFTKIFKKTPDFANEADQIAMNIIAYGYGAKQGYVKDQAKEEAALKTFQSIYGRNPATDFERNIIHAIAYSGASR